MQLILSHSLPTSISSLFFCAQHCARSQQSVQRWLRHRLVQRAARLRGEQAQACTLRRGVWRLHLRALGLELSTAPDLLGDLGHVGTILHTSAPAGFLIKKDAWHRAGADEIFVILN